MNVIALLPMKGHSERVPNKNLREFCGRPLYHWIAKALMDSQYVHKILINTDSEIIANDAKNNFDRVEIINRPEEICGDFVSMNKIIEYDLSRSEGDYFLQTHSTNPLLTAQTIDRAVDCFMNNRDVYDSLFSVTRLQTRLYWSDGRPINHNPQELLRTQDLSPVFEENSNLYIFSRQSFLSNDNRRIGKKPYMFEIDRLEAVDIDDELDFKIAELLKSMK